MSTFNIDNSSLLVASAVFLRFATVGGRVIDNYRAGAPLVGPEGDCRDPVSELRPYRLRPRGVLAHRLADAWKDASRAGVWRKCVEDCGLRWKDLQSQSLARRTLAFVQLSMGPESKVFGGDCVTTKPGTAATVVGVVPGGGAEGVGLVCPELMSHLQVYFSLRPRTAATLGLLRTRAKLWCEEMEIPDREAALFLPCTMARVVHLSVQEHLGMRMLSSVQTTEAGELTSYGRSGVFASTYAHPLRAMGETGVFPWITNRVRALFGRRAFLPLA